MGFKWSRTVPPPPRRLFKKAVQQGRSERRGEAYSPLYVELLSDARTTLADFFNSLLVMCQDIERHCVGLAVKILEQGIFEDLVVGGRGHEQGQA